MTGFYGLVQLANMQKLDSKWTEARDQRRQGVLVYKLVPQLGIFHVSVHPSELVSLSHSDSQLPPSPMTAHALVLKNKLQ